MSERIHALAQLLPGKNALDECSVDELQHLTKRYPYFAPAQFLLLQKLKSIGSPDAEAQQRKAVLYYHDPLQFDYFVSSEKFFIDEALLTQKNSSSDRSIAPEIDDLQQTENIIADEQAFIQQATDDANSTGVAEAVQRPSEMPEVTPEEEEATAIVPPPSEVKETEVHRQEHAALEEVSPSTEKTAADEPIQEPEETEPDETHLLPDPPTDETDMAADEPAATLPQEKLHPVPSTSPTVVTENQPASSPTKEREALAFEPFHTVDYFASQGIKISAEELPKDRLTKQVRSFTEWLKVMKRLPASEMAKSPESPAEKTVETLASHSVEESDVVTEAMAEVWAKQGNKSKAIETYNKLSLLNPSKKAYFAAKIENLKGS